MIQILILIGVILVFYSFPVLKCLVLNIHKVIINLPRDIYLYFKQKKYNLIKTGEIVAFCGLFGKGKTLSLVHKVVKAYNYGNGKTVYCMRRNKFVKQRIKVISNVTLAIPYENFVSLEQVVYAAENNKLYDDENDTLTITLVLGDEFSVQLNSRSFKTNINPLFLNTILTCRHHYISLYYSAQRFGHVDALLRQVTSYVVDCNKYWRIQCNYRYDAWQLENASSPKLVKPYLRLAWFVSNKDYNAYNTLACVGNLKKSMIDGDMISEEEILRLQMNTLDTEQIITPSRSYKRLRKKIG